MGGPGRQRRARLKEAIEGLYAEKPTDFMLKRAADSLGIDVTQIPPFDEVQQLQAWVFVVRSLEGSQEHARELNDRTDPKPSRSSIDIKVNRSSSQAANVSDEDAAAYYGRLTPEDRDD